MLQGRTCPSPFPAPRDAHAPGVWPLPPPPKSGISGGVLLVLLSPWFCLLCFPLPLIRTPVITWGSPGKCRDTSHLRVSRVAVLIPFSVYPPLPCKLEYSPFSEMRTQDVVGRQVAFYPFTQSKEWPCEHACRPPSSGDEGRNEWRSPCRCPGDSADLLRRGS